MMNKQFRKLYLVAIIVFGIFIVLRVRIPENVTKFEFVEVGGNMFSYSLIPDGSGIIYIGSSRIPSTYNDKLKNSFYYLNFKDKSVQLIHELESDSRIPVVYWVDPEIAILTRQSMGRCYDDTLQGTVTFNLETKEKQPAECLDGKGFVNPQFDTAQFDTTPYSSDSNKKIYSLTQKYYFVRRFIPGLFEGNGPEYIEIYNAYGVILRVIRLGPTGQMTSSPNYTGYIGFWTNKDEIVITPDVFYSNEELQKFKIYFIPPQR
jgi:hypothetical protein